MTDTDIRPRSVWSGGNFYIKPGRAHIWFSCIGEQTAMPISTANHDPVVALVWKSLYLTVLAAEEHLTRDVSIRRVTVTHKARWATVPELMAMRDVFFETGAHVVALIPTEPNFRSGLTICETRGLEP